MAEIESKYDLDVSGVLAALDQVDNRFDLHEAKRSKITGDPFKQAAQGATNLDQKLAEGVQTYGKVETAVKEMREEMKKFGVEQNNISKKQKEFLGAAKYSKVKSELATVTTELKRVQAALDNTNKKAKEGSGLFSKLKGGIMGALGGFAGGGGAGVTAISTVAGTISGPLGLITGLLGGLGTAAYQAEAGFQGLEATLGVALGSVDLANKDLEVLQNLAVKLPTGLDELSQAFNSLVNRGFKPTSEELSNLSGLAASQNKSFSQLTEALLDAEQGELERLKEFGIQATNEGDKVKISFKGVTKEFVKGANESTKAFSEMAKEIGLDKLNEAKMKTLEGRMSNLGDTADRITRTIGKFLLPVFEKLFDLAEGALAGIDEMIKGFTLFDKTLKDVGNTTDEVTFPALDRLFTMFDDDSKGGAIEKFAFNFSKKFSKIKNAISGVISELDYFGKLNSSILNLINAGNGYGFKEFRKDREEAQKQVEADRKKFTENVRTLRDIDFDTVKAEQEYQLKVQGLMNRKIGPKDELVYGKDGPKKKKELTKKELDDAKKAADKLADLQKDFQAEKLKLEEQFGKERLETLSGDQLKYIAEKGRLDKQEIELERAKYLALKKAAYGKKSTLSASETKTFDTRIGFVDDRMSLETDKFNQEKIEKASDNERAITEALSNEYQKQLQDIEHKYEELFKLSELDGKKRLKLEQQKEKEIAKATLDNDLGKLDTEKDLTLQNAEINVLEAQIKDRFDLEMQARRDLLQLEKDYNEEKIKLIQQSGTDDIAARVLPLEKANLEIDKDLKEIDKTVKAAKFTSKYWIEKLFGEDGAEALNEAASSIMGSINELYASNLQLSQNRISRIDDEITAKEKQVDEEKELNEKGVANNLDLRQKELADLKAARERALKDQQRIQRAQLLIDTASQASSMISAAAKVYAGFAGIPIVGVGLGVAAVALMLGAFAAAKIKAFQLVKASSAEKYEDGGEVGGRRHSEGGTLIEAEKGEYVTNRKSTAKYYDLIEAINHDNEGHVMDYLLKDLLSGTGIGMSEPERKKALRFMHKHDAAMQSKENDMINELREVKEELVFIKKHTSKISDIHYVNAGENKIAKIGPNSTVVTELPSG